MRFRTLSSISWFQAPRTSVQIPEGGAHKPADQHQRHPRSREQKCPGGGPEQMIGVRADDYALPQRPVATRVGERAPQESPHAVEMPLNAPRRSRVAWTPVEGGVAHETPSAIGEAADQLEHPFEEPPD